MLVGLVDCRWELAAWLFVKHSQTTRAASSCFMSSLFNRLVTITERKNASLMYFLQTICPKGCITSALLCVCGRDWMWSASLVLYLFFSSPDVEQSDMLLCTDGNTRPRETHTHIFIQLHEWLAVSSALFWSHTATQVHYCFFFSCLFTTCCSFISRLFSLHCIQRMWDDVSLYVWLCHFL